jgi:heme/copper-type cytochrome/quinol oxidase subunit 2
MNIVDLLIMIIVVTILVTIALGIVTYVAYKLRRARRPATETDAGRDSWYFLRFDPQASPADEK